MTRFRFAPVWFLPLAVLFITTLASAASASSDKDAIAALLERGRKAFDAHDVNAIMANYAPGDQLFVFDVIPPREYPSWDAYKKDWQELFEQFPGPIHKWIDGLQPLCGRRNDDGERWVDFQVGRADDGCVSKDRREVADRSRTCLGARGPGDGQGGFAVEAVRD